MELIRTPAERVPASAFPRLGKLIGEYANEISKRMGFGLNGNGGNGNSHAVAGNH